MPGAVIKYVILIKTGYIVVLKFHGIYSLRVLCEQLQVFKFHGSQIFLKNVPCPLPLKDRF